jgi:hypothetical protein
MMHKRSSHYSPVSLDVKRTSEDTGSVKQVSSQLEMLQSMLIFYQLTPNLSNSLLLRTESHLVQDKAIGFLVSQLASDNPLHRGLIVSQVRIPLTLLTQP